MWLSIALGYCVVCWLIGFLATRTAWWAAAFGGSASRVPLFEFAAILFAPIYIPLLVLLVGKCVVSAIRANRVLVQSYRTFRAYEFVPVDLPQLDDSIREQFELHTPPLLKLDFDLIGDYRLKPEPIEVHDRFFLSPDGKTLASISALLDTGAVCFISVLDDGTCVDTCSAENPDPDRVFEPADQAWVTYFADAPIEDLYAHHLKTLEELCARNGAGVLRFQKEQFRAVVTYDQRINCRLRFRLGDMDQEPPAPEFASLHATPAASSVNPEQTVVAS